MGTLRLLLALAVVAQHTFGVILLSGAQAVEGFFAVSGFLMSYLLVEAKTYSSPINFWKNRVLRIFPLYWFVLLISLIFNLATSISGFVQTLADVPIFAKLLLLFSNFFIFLQDWVMLLDLNHGQLVLKDSFENFKYHLHWGLLIPQSWTLALEIMFYALAPFILRNRKIFLICLAASLFSRTIFELLSLPVDPWIYRFFPNELCIFLLGSFSHQLVSRIYTKLRILDSAKVVSVISVITISGILSVNLLQGSDNLKTFALIIFLVLGLPFLFRINKIFKVDNFLGSLSYPVYLWHLVIFWYLNMKTGYTLLPLQLFVWTAIFSIAASVVTNKYLDEPIQRIRLTNKIGYQETSNPV